MVGCDKLHVIALIRWLQEKIEGKDPLSLPRELTSMAISRAWNMMVTSSSLMLVCSC